MALPSVSADAIALWSSIPQFIQDADAANGYLLLLWLDGPCSILQGIDDIVRDSTAGPGWSSVMDVTRCPDQYLPWLAQFVGIRFNSEQINPIAQRNAIESLGNFTRGTVGALTAAATPFIPPGVTMTIVERYPDPYTFLIVLRGPGASLSYAQIEAEFQTYKSVQSAFPFYGDAQAAGGIPAYSLYQDVEGLFSTYTAIEAAYNSAPRNTYLAAQSGTGFPRLLEELQAAKPAGLVMNVELL